MKKPRVAFEDTTVKSRVGEKPGPGLGIAVADFDGDGWPDVFVANDGQPNHLWMNQKDGTFREEAPARGVARTGMGQAFAGMGVAIGDVDGDGLLDLYVTHLTSETNTLWKQSPRGQFRDQSTAWGLTSTKWRGTGFGTLMADFDNDGCARHRRCQRPRRSRTGWAKKAEHGSALGTVRRTESVVRQHRRGEVQRPLAQQSGALRLLHGGSRIGVRRCRWRRCAGFAGECDRREGAIVQERRAESRTLDCGTRARCRAQSRRDWSRSRRSSRRRERVRVVGSSDSFLSAGPLVVHVGLGTATTVEAFDVTWPDGAREIVPRRTSRPPSRTP